MNTLSRVFISVFALSVIVGVSVSAQENVEERISNVESIVSKLPKMSGVINMRYRYDSSDETDGFDIRRARLDFRGSVVKGLDYRLHLEFANSPKILDAFLQWKINDYVSLQAGQYKIPFSLENPYNPANLETVENSLAITNLVNYSDVSGLSANGRDVGLSLVGSFLRRDGYSIVNYYFGVLNGQGSNVGRDANKAKDFSGILTVNPVKPLSLAVSHYNGSTVQSGDTLYRVRTGFGAKYDDGKLLARSEYFLGKTGKTESEGAYAVVAYYVHTKIQPLAKFDYFKRNVDDDSTAQQHYIVGVNYFPVNNIRLQLNYTRKTYHESSSSKDSNFVVAQLWIRF